MATIRAYTTIEQIRKLTEILPIESADMYYGYGKNKPEFLPVSDGDVKCLSIPCWSLTSLLGVLPDYTLQTNPNGTVFVVSEKEKPIMSDDYDNPVDACYEMILKLHKLKLM